MKSLAFLLIFTFLTGFAAAQDSEKTPEPWANKLFSGPGNINHDFGTAQRGKKLRHEFEFTNIYKVPLEVIEIRTHSSAVAITDKKVLQPNEKGRVNLEVNTVRFSGTRGGYIHVTFGPKWISTAWLSWAVTISDDKAK